MAKNIAVYSGSTSTYSYTYTAIYTVPAGRVAKVDFSFLRVSDGDQGIGLKINGVNFIPGDSVATNMGFPSGYVGTSEISIPSDCHLFNTVKPLSSPLASGAQILPRYYYLAAGQKVEISGKTNYSFCVIEEY